MACRHSKTVFKINVTIAKPARIEAPAKAIDAQVKAFEEKQKMEKRIKIGEILQKNLDEKVSDNIRQFVSVSPAKLETWQNASYTFKKIEAEIVEIVDKKVADFQAIYSFGSVFEVQLIDKYKQTGELSAVMVEKSRLEAIAKAREEAKSKEAGFKFPDFHSI